VNRLFRYRSLIIMSGNQILSSLLSSTIQTLKRRKPMKSTTLEPKLPSLMRTSLELLDLIIQILLSSPTESTSISTLIERMAQTEQFHAISELWTQDHKECIQPQPLDLHKRMSIISQSIKRLSSLMVKHTSRLRFLLSTKKTEHWKNS